MRNPLRSPLALATLICAGASLTLALGTASAQGRGGGLSDSARAQRWAIENELQSLAIVERKVMIPMRDGVRNYDILGRRVSDGEDELNYLHWRPWSNMQGFGAGVGRVGPYYEQGNW